MSPSNNAFEIFNTVNRLYQNLKEWSATMKLSYPVIEGRALIMDNLKVFGNAIASEKGQGLSWVKKFWVTMLQIRSLAALAPTPSSP
jgi:hypothetical protein